MVKASRPAATRLVASAISPTENRLKMTPSARASERCTRPDGTGRLRVRRIRPSMSESKPMFSAPDAPAPTAMQKTAITARKGFMGVRAQTRPVAAVNTTSDITRGLRSWT